MVALIVLILIGSFAGIMFHLPTTWYTELTTQIRNRQRAFDDLIEEYRK